MNARRIVVYGVTGSGKTTLARKLAEATGLPHINVDELTWNPGWEFVPFDDQRTLFRTICAGEDWILDNAYGHWIEIPIERVELIIALDYPRWLSFWRLLKRTMSRLIDQTAVCNGNRESLRMILSRRSILLWHITSFQRKRDRIRAWVAEGKNVVHLRNPGQAKRWLASIR